jgi:aryl-alcohol dehydrogenase-like predicted oxidoreductase
MQNEYSLLCRLYDTDMAELSVNEDVGLLAFSPLATGLLTGKYQNGAVPQGSRRTHVDSLGGRISDRVFPAVDAYLDIARTFGLDPVHMALAWCRTRPFMASAIFGATRTAQLKHALASVDVTLDQEVLDALIEVHRAHPMVY